MRSRSTHVPVAPSAVSRRERATEEFARHGHGARGAQRLSASRRGDVRSASTTLSGTPEGPPGEVLPGHGRRGLPDRERGPRGYVGVAQTLSALA